MVAAICMAPLLAVSCMGEWQWFVWESGSDLYGQPPTHCSAVPSLSTLPVPVSALARGTETPLRKPLFPLQSTRSAGGFAGIISEISLVLMLQHLCIEF